MKSGLCPRKRGKNRFKEPQVATRKSSRIQDQGIPMQEKASLLKSIQNLDTLGKIVTNSFTILNDSHVHYLGVASSCGIVLSSQSVSVKEVILAMQAQKLVRAAVAKADRTAIKI